ncbi:type III-B CRISPR module RAMP protein Cmr1 [Candidatus Parcubacteria bacterium]|nr:MAG: type III-B CRISPR module RAMP protein Cmr1 [Candidatus Parcubacteria bacterium]
MKTIEATYRIVTPMFIGGGRRRPDDGVRPPSFKGALRFWWRALNWPRLRHEEGDDACALRRLHAEEADLFGAAAKSRDGRQAGGQSRILIRVKKQPSLQPIEDRWPNPHTQRGEESKSGYLGLGLFPMGEHRRRQGIRENQQFVVALAFKRGTSEKDVESIRDALLAIGIFGGLGSRNRKGFGSVAIERIDEESHVCSSCEEYVEKCRQVLQGGSAPFPPFTALNNKLRLGVINQLFPSARDAHSALARRYLAVRGQGGVVRGEDKLAFGLPLKDYEEDPNIRRASPLFMHIHPVSGKYLASCLYLPSVFHPNYPQGNELAFFHGVEVFMDKLDTVGVES